MTDLLLHSHSTEKKARQDIRALTYNDNKTRHSSKQCPYTISISGSVTNAI